MAWTNNYLLGRSYIKIKNLFQVVNLKHALFVLYQKYIKRCIIIRLLVLFFKVTLDNRTSRGPHRINYL